LYCIVLYCIVLYCIVLYCIVLYCIVFYWIVLYWIVLYCIVLCFFVNIVFSAVDSLNITSIQYNYTLGKNSYFVCCYCHYFYLLIFQYYFLAIGLLILLVSSKLRVFQLSFKCLYCLFRWLSFYICMNYYVCFKLFCSKHIMILFMILDC